MPTKTYKLTKEGYKQLEKKLKNLKTVSRQEIIEKMRQAKESGPMEENTEFENAKEEQAELEREIMKLENILRNAQILKKSEVQADKVDVGTTVTVEYLEEKQALTFEIVSSQESDPTRTPPRISDESPVGVSLMERKVGDEIEVEIPLGLVTYKITTIINTP